MVTLISARQAVAGQSLPASLSWGRRILTMLSVRRSRLDLSQLSDAQLSDIGLSRDQVAQEIARPLWDVPSNWRR